MTDAQREQLVAWLRRLAAREKWSESYLGEGLGEIADDIERGDHWGDGHGNPFDEPSP